MRALAAVVLAFGLAGCSARAAMSCADLKSLSLGDATLVQAQPIAAGPFAVPAAPGAPAQSITLPAFCRVQGVIAPTQDSHIEFEVWLPATGWNGKYQGVGNGGFAGAIEFRGLTFLRAGYAA